MRVERTTRLASGRLDSLGATCVLFLGRGGRAGTRPVPGADCAVPDAERDFPELASAGRRDDFAARAPVGAGRSSWFFCRESLDFCAATGRVYTESSELTAAFERSSRLLPAPA